MTKKRKAPTPKKEWQPLIKSPAWADEQRHAEIVSKIRAHFPGLTDDEIRARAPDDIFAMPAEVWGNDRYTVTVHYLDDNRDDFVEVGIHNHKRTIHVPWRHVQQIKNELFGADREAVQLFPAEDRLVDCANEYWIYIYPTGTAPMRPLKYKTPAQTETKLGMDSGRIVSYDMASAISAGARQAPEMKIQTTSV